MSPELVLNTRRNAISDLRRVCNPEIGIVASAEGRFAELHYGRDAYESIIMIAEQDHGDLTPYIIEISERTLRTGMQYEGMETNPHTFEEPGRKAHEVQTRNFHQERLAEMAKNPKWPIKRHEDGTYSMQNYFSNDATPKFNIASGAVEKSIRRYFGGSEDICESFLREVYPSVKRGAIHDMKIIDKYKLGVYVSDPGDSPMLNHTWKDSNDAYMDEKGNIPKPPYMYLGVNSFVYWSFLETAQMAEIENDSDFARELKWRASRIRERINSVFWSDELNYLVPLIDGFGNQDEIVTSDAIDALWSGVLSRENAKSVVNRLDQPDMMTAWGPRTRSSDSKFFNVNGYHKGTVWPKDGFQAAIGAEKYGFHRFAHKLDERCALLNAEVGSEELLDVERDGVTIRPYTEEGRAVSNKPQAWSASGALARSAARSRGLLSASFAA